MEQIVKFLRENKSGALSTSFKNEPYVRPQHVHYIENNTFYFTTANVKRAYEQLKENPVIEFMVANDQFQTVRIRGQVKFTDSLEIKQTVMDHAPLVEKGYKTADNPVFEVFYLEHGEATYSDFSGEPPKTFNF